MIYKFSKIIILTMLLLELISIVNGYFLLRRRIVKREIFISEAIFPPIPNGFQRQVFYNNLILLINDSKKLTNGNIEAYCEIQKIHPNKQSEILKKSRVFEKPIHLTFDMMLNMIISYCQKLKEKQINRTSEYTTGIFRDTKNAMFYPGTKWCGDGDTAINYHDLGNNIKLDKCCRAHDLCPVSIPPGQTRYGIKNKNEYTRSHCDCDNAFEKCVRAISLWEKVVSFVMTRILIAPCIKPTLFNEPSNKSTSRP